MADMTMFTVRWNMGKNAWKAGSNERWNELDIKADNLDQILALVTKRASYLPPGLTKDTLRSVRVGEDLVWQRPIRMPEVVAEHEAAEARAAKKAQRWLREQLTQWLADEPTWRWITVTLVPEFADTDTITCVEVRSLADGEEAPNREWDLDTELGEYTHYLHLGMPWGAWVRMTREGKVYRTSAKHVAELREEEKKG